jgi:hypothetical protein
MKLFRETNLYLFYLLLKNQFFVTTVDPKNDPDVKNGIGQALLDRIVKAHRYSY